VQKRHDEVDRLTAKTVETESLFQRAEDMRYQVHTDGDVVGVGDGCVFARIVQAWVDCRQRATRSA